MATNDMPPAQSDALQAQIYNLWATTLPDERTLHNRAQLIARLQKIVQQQYECHYTMEVFGSTSYGVGGAMSDLDLAIIDHERLDGFAPHISMSKLPIIYNLTQLARTLTQNGFVDVRPIFAAIPIVKLTDPHTRIQCDICINDTFGVHNSRLIKAYLDLIPSLGRAIITTIRLWAKNRRINDPGAKDGPTSLSSYSLTLLLIAYLQQRGILPNLQADSSIEQAGIQRCYLWARPAKQKSGAKKKSQVYELPIEPRVSCDITFVAQPASWHPVPYARNAAEILIGFFNFFSGEGQGAFDYTRHIVAPALGGVASRQEIFQNTSGKFKKNKAKTRDDIASGSSSQQPQKWKENMLVIQDPFITTRNTCLHIKPQTVRHIISEFCRARDLLAGGANIQTLSTPAEKIGKGTMSKQRHGASVKPMISTGRPVDGVYVLQARDSSGPRAGGMVTDAVPSTSYRH